MTKLLSLGCVSPIPSWVVHTWGLFLISSIPSWAVYTWALLLISSIPSWVVYTRGLLLISPIPSWVVYTWGLFLMCSPLICIKISPAQSESFRVVSSLLKKKAVTTNSTNNKKYLHWTFWLLSKDRGYKNNGANYIQISLRTNTGELEKISVNYVGIKGKFT